MSMVHGAAPTKSRRTANGSADGRPMTGSAGYQYGRGFSVSIVDVSGILDHPLSR